MSGSSKEREGSGLAIAAVISTLLHLIVGVAVFGRMDATALLRHEAGANEAEPAAQDEENPAEPKRPRLRLGIERSSHASVTWLGFETPEEHQVTEESKVEQAALARQDVSGMRAGIPNAQGQDEGDSVAASTPAGAQAPAERSLDQAAEANPPIVAPVEPAQDRVAPSATPATAEPESVEPRAEATSLPTPAVVTVPEVGPEVDGPARDESLELTEKIGPKPREVSDEAKEPVESPSKPDSTPKPASGEAAPEAVPVVTPAVTPVGAPVATPAGAASPGAPSESAPLPEGSTSAEAAEGAELSVSRGNAESPGDGNAIRVGLRSDKESPASALKRAIKFDPKKPKAVQGLELTTVEPRFPVSVRLTSNPRNPVVVIHFDRKGIVTRVDFLRDEKKEIVYNTGEPAVDEPLRTAIFQWRAKGEELLRIPADNPEATVSIVMEILLRGR